MRAKILQKRNKKKHSTSRMPFSIFFVKYYLHFNTSFIWKLAASALGPLRALV